MGGRAVFVAHCILNQNSKALGFASRPGLVEWLIDFLKQGGCVVEQLPCPEMLYLGVNRWWHTRDQYDTPGFRRHCRRLAKMVADLMEYYLRRGLAIVLIGVDGSPSCGVNLTGRNPYWGGEPKASAEQYQVVEGMGVWMEELLKEVKRRGIKRFKVIGLAMDLPGFDLKRSLKMLEAELEG